MELREESGKNAKDDSRANFFVAEVAALRVR